jgi:hypothetical protein
MVLQIPVHDQVAPLQLGLLWRFWHDKYGETKLLTSCPGSKKRSEQEEVGRNFIFFTDMPLNI